MYVKKIKYKIKVAKVKAAEIKEMKSTHSYCGNK